MEKYVIVATRGRAAEVGHLLDALLEQDGGVDAIYVIGADAPDLAGLDVHPLHRHTRVRLLISPITGTTAQRNYGIDALIEDLGPIAGVGREPWFAVFFDDDFRPARDWLSACAAVFERDPGLAALTGRVLADGIKGAGLTEAEARAYLHGGRPPLAHWASGDMQREIACVYGCNMAFTARVVRACRFDESLPLYGWQEDQDYTAQAARFGRAVFDPMCAGVHLGSKRGRTSGFRMGYSQVANPVFLMKKRTMRTRKALWFIARSLLSNIVHGLARHPFVDYRGRLVGNLMACTDLLRGRSHPKRVLDFDV